MRTLKSITLIAFILINSLINAQEMDSIKMESKCKIAKETKMAIFHLPYGKSKNSNNISSKEARMFMDSKIKDEQKKRKTKMIIAAAYLVYFIIFFSL